MARHTIHLLEVEAASLNGDARRAFDRAGEHSERLAHIAREAYEVALGEAFSDADPEELEHRASALVTCALGAHAAAIEIAVQAGRLNQLASVRRDAEPLPEDEEDES